MADYTIVNLTTAVVGIVSTISNQIQSTNSNNVTVTNGNLTIGNYTTESSTSAVPGSLTGRRPSQGQVFPRGVYNK